MPLHEKRLRTVHPVPAMRPCVLTGQEPPNPEAVVHL